jgi:hypothetical protein
MPFRSTGPDLALLHIRHGKRQKERMVPLSPRLLERLRSYWREYRPAPWLFPGIKPALALTDGSLGPLPVVLRPFTPFVHVACQPRHCRRRLGAKSPERPADPSVLSTAIPARCSATSWRANTSTPSTTGPTH